MLEKTYLIGLESENKAPVYFEYLFKLCLH